MELLPTPFDFDDALSDEELDIFTECIVFDEYGDFSNIRNFDYLSETVDKVLNPKGEKLEKSDNFLAKYTAGIKKNKERRKNSKVKNELSLVTLDKDDDSQSSYAYGTVDENKIAMSGGLESTLATAEFVDDWDAILYSLSMYEEVKPEFERIEGVDLDTLLVRALEGVPKAVSVVRRLVEKYKFLSKIIEDIMTARKHGHNVLPDLD